mmetsp:Transcript_17592/g.16823  ORF Transcript_17592/g.16823 Transcript_17592/m.16823 type:complete len:453 (-) Transcript_17592:1224-2582(-)
MCLILFGSQTRSELVHEVFQLRDAWLESLPLPDSFHKGSSLGAGIIWVRRNLLPMVKHALRESSSGGELSQVLGEPEGLSHRQVSLHNDQRSSINWLFSNDDSSSGGEAVVDSTHSIIRGLDFAHEDRLLESGSSSEEGSIEDSSGSGDDLAATSVDSISMESHIHHIEPDSSHVLFGHDRLFGGPLEGSFHGVFDFVEVLDGLGLVSEEIGAGGLWAEAPDLHGLILVPVVLLSKDLVPLLLVHLESNHIILNVVGKVISQGSGLHVDSVVLVGGLGKALPVTLSRDTLLVGDHRVRFLDLNLSILVHQVIEADFNVEFSAAGNDMFARLFGVADDEWVALGELLEAFDEFGEVRGVLGLDGHSHDGGDGVLHDSDVVGVFVVGDGSLLHEVLVHTHQTHSVPAGHIRDSLLLPAHHQDGPLDALHVQVVLGAWGVVGSHDPHFLAGGDDP